ncbi:MAG: hypothetical protein LAP21_27985 [Acidobacteriia bacterium]|nr:hypothetical protein [Terriglobia bacterium]
MATLKATRSVPSAQPKRRPDQHFKTELFEALHDLNKSLSRTVSVLHRLDAFRVFRKKYLQDYRNMTEELRSLFNHELTKTLADLEQRDAARFGAWKKNSQKTQ